MPFVLALLLALVPVTAAAEDSLCRRLGGSDAISAVVKSFLMKMTPTSSVGSGSIAALTAWRGKSN